jgi:hypothetical protein
MNLGKVILKNGLVSLGSEVGVCEGARSSGNIMWSGTRNERWN